MYTCAITQQLSSRCAHFHWFRCAYGNRHWAILHILFGFFTGFVYMHDDVIKWKHFPRYWPFVRGIHRSPVNSPHKGQWRGALMFTLICARINGWVNNREAGHLRRYSTHYDVIVMESQITVMSVKKPWKIRVNDPHGSTRTDTVTQ